MSRRWLLAVLALPVLAHAGRRAVADPDVHDVAAQLLGRTLTSDEPWQELVQLADGIGHRLAGSPALERAVTWGADRMREDGLSVTLEPVTVPVWVRGQEHGAIVAPLTDELPLLGLGWTVATPADGLEADVLVVTSFDELTKRASEAAGRIVVFDVPFTSYGDTVQYRGGAPAAAAKVGAVATLVRSVTPESLSTPHTGATRYDPALPKIPAAAITTEDAARLHRWQDQGHTPRLRLRLSGRDAGTATSHNVVGELRGRSLPDEVIVLGCHLDSWDVGQGAQDDGAGCVTVMEAAAQLAALPVRPRRTVRVVLFTNEESGLAGGKAYAASHTNERIVAAVEDDTGAGRPLGFHVDARFDASTPDDARAARVIAALSPGLRALQTLGSDSLTVGFSGADIGPLVGAGAVGFGLDHDMSGYWRIHHTEADTLDKIDPSMVRHNAASMAVFAWLLAELPDPFGDGAR